MNKKTTAEQLTNSDWNFPMHTLPHLTSSQKSFVNNEFLGKRSLANYNERVEFLGLTGLTRVLDAGCGMGQWAIALGMQNKEVVGIDIDASRLYVGDQLAKANGLDNVSFENSALEKTPFEDNSFDAVFCYSVIMFTNISETLAEFRRILKPNGKVYAMTDLWPWYYDMVKKDKRNIKAIAKMGVKSVLQSKKYFFSEKWFVKQFEKAGFVNVKSELEGFASFNENSGKPSENIIFYESMLNNKKALIEVIAHNPS